MAPRVATCDISSPGIPVEILERILNELKGYDTGLSADVSGSFSSTLAFGPEVLPEGRYHLVTKVALLSRPFHPFVMPSVWQHVIIRSGSRLKELVEFTKPGQPGASFPSYTKRLVLQIKDGYVPRHAEKLISRMTNLKVLILGNGPFASSRHLPTLVMHAITDACSNLEALHVRSTSEYLTLPQLVTIANSCKKLQVLQLFTLAETDDESWVYGSPVEVVTPSLPLMERLEVLSLGSGPAEFSPLSVSTPENYHFHTLVHVMLTNTGQFPALDRAREKVEALVCGSKWGRWIMREKWPSFTKLKNLVVVVDSQWDDLPSNLPNVQVVELIQIYLLAPRSQILDATDGVLRGLVRVAPGWGSLRRVVLRAERTYGTTQQWVAYSKRFEALGIGFLCEYTSTI
ncbi:hypothetical protein NMY22_g10300 [Coprinellus aureogranulatus]|nr:hypothetical protein NMY22_g10300 [Coprinellus aureogranulatus]